MITLSQIALSRAQFKTHLFLRYMKYQELLLYLVEIAALNATNLVIYQVCSWCVVMEHFHYVKSGCLVLPLSVESDEFVKCFVPCEGVDLETEEAGEIHISDILPFNPQNFKNLKEKGIGNMPGIANIDWTSIISKQVEAGNFLECHRPEYHEVWMVGDNAFFPEGASDSIRLRSSFVRNVNKQPVDIIKVPVAWFNIEVSEEYPE